MNTHRECDDLGGCAVYTLRDLRHGESQQVVVCTVHAQEMPLIDGERVTASEGRLMKCEIRFPVRAEVSFSGDDWCDPDLRRDMAEIVLVIDAGNASHAIRVFQDKLQELFQ